jgi:tetratricopeptide (TPR) repeat protein
MKRMAKTGMALAVLPLAAWFLAGCASPKAQFTDADWVSHSTTGRGCYERGDFRRGAEAYGKAELRAQAMDDANALAVAAVNRAVCLLAEGKAAESLDRVEAALADSRVSKDRQAELQVAGARAELALGKPEEALAKAEAALKLDPAPALRAQALLAQSAAELKKGNAIPAAKALTDGLSERQWGKLPEAIRAEYAGRRAEIAAAEKRPADAVPLQDEATALWRKAGRLPEMARSLTAAGQQAKASGDLAGACDRYYWAARSLWAQGFQTDAVHALEAGVKCAEQLNDEEVARRMAKLLVTFNGKKRLSE